MSFEVSAQVAWLGDPCCVFLFTHSFLVRSISEIISLLCFRSLTEFHDTFLKLDYSLVILGEGQGLLTGSRGF